MRVSLISFIVAAVLTGCGSASGSGPTSSGAGATVLPTTTPHTTPRRHRQKPAHHKASRSREPSRQSTPRVLLPVSSASGHRVQPQPAPGSCHATGHGEFVMPDPHCTPGAVSPTVTQANIHQTICVPGYTETVRPSESITEPEKLASMAAYGDAGRSAREFEYDHLVSLELGGAVNDPRNLWPQAGASPNSKDTIESALHRMVCDGQIRLALAQHLIATDWVGWARSHNQSGSTAATPGPASAPSRSSSGPSGAADVNCSDFATHAAAQRWFAAHGGSAAHDVAGLDRDHDGQACESLP